MRLIIKRLTRNGPMIKAPPSCSSFIAVSSIVSILNSVRLIQAGYYLSDSGRSATIILVFVYNICGTYSAIG